MKNESQVFSPEGLKDVFALPIFEFAQPDDQIAAAISFIDSTKSYCADKERFDYADHIFNKLHDCNDSQFAVRSAINCFDFCISDEIRIYEGVKPQLTDNAAVYYRSDVYKQTYPSIIVGSLTDAIGYVPTDIIIANPEIVQSLSAPMHKGYITDEVMYAVNLENQRLDLPNPPVGMPRQEFYRSLLGCGINPLVGKEESALAFCGDAINDNRLYRRLHRLRSSLAILANKNELLERQSFVESHWGSILSESEENFVNLYTSGTASNEIAMKSVASISQEKTYIHPYWYYENMSTANSVFESVVSDSDDASSLLINLEPTNFFTFDKKPQEPIELIRKFVDKALVDNQQNYYLIIDITVNPLFKIIDECSISKIPSNLTIIKTISATKHQDGGRNHFFGVLHSNNHKINDIIKNNEEIIEEGLYESQIVHFPVPTIDKLMNRRQKIADLNSAISISNCESLWRYEPSSYNSFLIPSTDAINLLVDNMKKIVCVNERDEYIKSVNKKIYSAVVETVREANISNIEVGDSFGFPVARVNTQGGQNIIGDVKFNLKIPRISPGYNSSEAELSSVAAVLRERLNMDWENILRSD